MDLIYLGIMAVFVLFTWGLTKICEVPPDGSSKEQSQISNQQRSSTQPKGKQE